jgi:autotransporter adhesin
MALGVSSEALGESSFAAGDFAQADGVASVAIGRDAFAASSGSVAIGDGATALSSVAVGAGAQATGTTTTALGDNALATGNNSVALGNASVADADNTVSVGSAGNERRITNVAPGVAPTDVATAGQVAATQAGLRQLDKRLDRVEEKAFAGIASAAALDLLVPPSAPGKTTLNAGVANFEGESAVGVNLTHRISGRKIENHRVSVNAGIAVSTENTVLTRALIGFEF